MAAYTFINNKSSRKLQDRGQYSLFNALRRGGPTVWLSCLFMGLGNIAGGQVLKGILFFLIEVGMLIFLLIPGGGMYQISLLPGLGDRVQEEAWNDALGVYEYIEGDRSQVILLYGIASVCIIFAFILIWKCSVCSGYRALCHKINNKSPITLKKELTNLFDENIHVLLMSAPTLALLIFTVLPLIYMMSMAFTNFSREGDHLVLFDWVGFDNFMSIFNSSSVIGKQFTEVLIWTLTWAFFATFLNFVLGTLVAMMINRPSTKFKSFWRVCLSMTIAVPQFVSLLVMRSMLQPEGIINRLLINGGLIDSRLPFFEDAAWARVLVIVINLWVGIPYTILQVTGVLNNIPSELYDATKVDGCTAVQTFFNVTVPYMMFVLTPYLITQFTGNINNFNIIYLLTRGEPMSVGNTAGATDLLITWLYKLSVDQQKYNLAAVIGIFTFIILSIVALVTYRSSGSYKNEEGFK